MLVTVHKLCHVLHASRITTCGTIFTERHFSVSKEWVRSWSHTFLITYHKTLIKKLFGGTSRNCDEKEKKKKKTRMKIVKFFALNANAKICQYRRLHMKIICWRFHIKTRFVFWDMRTWDMWKVPLQTFRNNKIC